MGWLSSRVLLTIQSYQSGRLSTQRKNLTPPRCLPASLTQTLTITTSSSSLLLQVTFYLKAETSMETSPISQRHAAYFARVAGHTYDSGASARQSRRDAACVHERFVCLTAWHGLSFLLLDRLCRRSPAITRYAICVWAREQDDEVID